MRRDTEDVIKSRQQLLLLLGDGLWHSTKELSSSITKVLREETSARWGGLSVNAGYRLFTLQTCKSWHKRGLVIGKTSQDKDSDWKIVATPQNLSQAVIALYSSAIKDDEPSSMELSGFVFRDMGKAMAVSFAIDMNTYHKIEKMAQENKLTIEKYMVKIIEEEMK